MNKDKKDECPICGEGFLTEIIEISDYGVPMKFSVCDHCGSEQASPEQMRWNKEIYQNHKNLSSLQLVDLYSVFRPVSGIS